MSKEEINAFLGSGTVYEGKLCFQGAVRIDGSFSGEIVSEGALIAGKDATIEGTVRVGEFILSGMFTGDVFARTRVVLHKTGVFSGTLNSPALIVEEGATLDGKLCMSKVDDRDRPGDDDALVKESV